MAALEEQMGRMQTYLQGLTANSAKLGRIPGYNDDQAARLSDALSPHVRQEEEAWAQAVVRQHDLDEQLNASQSWTALPKLTHVKSERAPEGTAQLAEVLRTRLHSCRNNPFCAL
eukprot:TRINITY_DN10360_c0_g1_i2.p2 TRINITY_DN10360_c0_g1~~TRINITY_DN10360_c0_g1_i2.p2  ORF type:complete len:122 (+),score=22.99 TRINITY_DN10360_c0_g1_i2:23-367(+)